MEDHKLAEKIRAILAKAEDENGSEEERDTAMRMAQRLLLKHGLTAADVGPGANGGRDHQQDEYLTTERAQAWKGGLLRALAPVYFCRVLTKRAGREGRALSWTIFDRRDYGQHCGVETTACGSRSRGRPAAAGYAA